MVHYRRTSHFKRGGDVIKDNLVRSGPEVNGLRVLTGLESVSEDKPTKDRLSKWISDTETYLHSFVPTVEVLGKADATPIIVVFADQDDHHPFLLEYLELASAGWGI